LVVVNSPAMYCPRCKAEYRRGFSRCSDCDIDLVYDLPQQPKENEEQYREEIEDVPSLAAEKSGNLQTVWIGDSADSCADACLELQDSVIAYRVSQQKESRSLEMEMKWKFEIAVRSSLYEKAKEVLGIEIDPLEKDLPDGAEIQAAMELPARDDLPVEEVHGDWNRKDWFPDDATLEIWSGNPKDSGSVVEMSLRENRINYRVEPESDVLKRVFVMLRDEMRAREIVREIVEGTPPE
jgi:hypothetical protein